MTVSRQAACPAASRQVPIRAPFSAGRPRLPVGSGFGPYSTAFDGSRVVHVAPLMTRDFPWNAASPVPCTSRPGNAPARSFSICAASSTWLAVPFPAHSLNSTGSADGDGQNGSRTTSAATAHVFPNAIFFPPCAAPSYAHRASCTLRPRLRKKVPSIATVIAVSYTHLRAHETRHDLVCRLLLEKKKKINKENTK